MKQLKTIVLLIFIISCSKKDDTPTPTPTPTGPKYTIEITGNRKPMFTIGTTKEFYYGWSPGTYKKDAVGNLTCYTYIDSTSKALPYTTTMPGAFGITIPYPINCNFKTGDWYVITITNNLNGMKVRTDTVNIMTTQKQFPSYNFS